MKNSYQKNMWSGKFGDEYTKRNKLSEEIINDTINSFKVIFKKIDIKCINNILEIGCNQGRNLESLSKLSNAILHGIEPNSSARSNLLSKKIIDEQNLHACFADKLPMKNNSIDLVFTSVVLIHIPDHDINKVINEIFRVSSKFILIIEYFSPVDECVIYRGKDDLLFKRDYGSLFLDNFKELKLVDYGFFWKRVTKQDNVNWWLFKKLS